MFPGETLVTEMWDAGQDCILFRVKVQERGEVAIADGLVTLYPASRAKTFSKSANGGKMYSLLKSAFNSLPEVRRKDLVAKSAGSFQFSVNSGAEREEFYIDLKAKEGTVGSGKLPNADITIGLSADTFAKLATGQVKGQTAFTKGLIKVKGNMMMASKLDPVMAALTSQLKAKL